MIPVILSGGSGTRLWPLSRKAHPKPFIKMPDGESLMQKTFTRASQLDGVEQMVVVTNRDYYFHSRDAYTSAGITQGVDYLLEPTGRDTAPAIAVAAQHVQRKYGSEALMLVLAADHIIENFDAFHQAVKKAVVPANENWLVTFGIQPNSPDTGFGYIHFGDETLPGVNRVDKFVEKPNSELAQSYLDSGEYLWNSGMFCFQAGALLNALADHAPQISQNLMPCLPADNVNSSMIEIDADAFNLLDKISIDYAVMEKAINVAVISCDIGWNDVGNWDAFADFMPTDVDNNHVFGDVFIKDSTDNVIYSENRLIATLGLENLVIVDTPDATLVATKGRAQDVKQIVKELENCNHEAHSLHTTVFRPWGTYCLLEEGQRFKIKRIEVKPQGSLSLQMHYHRNEHWVVVSGTARIINDDKEIILTANESTYIASGSKHRLENPGMVPLVLIEIQTGEYLGEDDIVRFEDVYGRVIE